MVPSNPPETVRTELALVEGDGKSMETSRTFRISMCTRKERHHDNGNEVIHIRRDVRARVQGGSALLSLRNTTSRTLSIHTW